MRKINTYKDLKIYQKSYELSLIVHKLTQKYPEYERYELASQTTNKKHTKNSQKNISH